MAAIWQNASGYYLDDCAEVPRKRAFWLSQREIKIKKRGRVAFCERDALV